MRLPPFLPGFLLCVIGCQAALTGDRSGGLAPDKIIPFKKVFGDVKELNLHLFQPENWAADGKFPAIVFFFGGAWSRGDPSQFYIHGKYFASRGMVVIGAEYRTRTSHGVMPYQCVEDGKSAMRFVRQHAHELGIDPNRIAAGGGSAGGQVAAATATIDHFDDGRYPETSPIPNALVLFNPVFDNGPDGFAYPRVKDYWTLFSPMHNIDENHPPTIVFLGDEDEGIPVATVRNYQKQMHNLGLRSELQIFSGLGHGFFNWDKYDYPDKTIFIATVSAADAFLASLGYLEGPPEIAAWLKANR